MMIQTTKDMAKNNLEELILLSGLTKREVAKAKGITPETLSRHIHGKIQLTMKDAEEYAEILNTTAYHILFATPEIPVIGRAHISGSVAKNNVRTTRTMDLRGIGKAFYPALIGRDTGVIHWTVDKEYEGPWRTWNNVWQMVKLPDLSDPIPDYCVQHLCVSKLEETLELRQGPTNFLTGILYPEPKNRWTVDINGHHPEDNTKTGLKIEYAMPVIATLMRPDIRGAKIIFD